MMCEWPSGLSGCSSQPPEREERGNCEEKKRTLKDLGFPNSFWSAMCNVVCNVLKNNDGLVMLQGV